MSKWRSLTPELVELIKCSVEWEDAEIRELYIQNRASGVVQEGKFEGIRDAQLPATAFISLLTMTPNFYVLKFLLWDVESLGVLHFPSNLDFSATFHAERVEIWFGEPEFRNAAFKCRRADVWWGGIEFIAAGYMIGDLVENLS